MSVHMDKLASLLRSLMPNEGKPEKHFNSAIILAGGSGTRMRSEGSETKQMMALCGIPVVARTVLAFENTPLVREIILVVKEDELGQYDALSRTYRWEKVVKIVKGGETRQDSALEGFKAIDDRSEYVLIHDAARCLVTREMIEKVASAAYRYGAAIAACHPHDTVKTENKQEMVAETLERDAVWLAQTPQIFKTELYRASAYTALAKGGLRVTDDASLAEAAGFAVKPVDCGRENIKLTTPEDIYVAEAILKAREESV